MDSRYRKRARLDAVVVDRLNDLPDCLLTDHILSRLGSRQAVQTSALSRRWRSLWRSVPCLDLDQLEFGGGSSWPKFEAFANAMLAATATTVPPPLDEFRLRALGNDWRASECLSAELLPGCLARFPAAADVRCGSPASGVMWPWFPKLGPATGTRRLTRLRLAGVSLVYGFRERLGEQCPALEHLHVERCRGVLRAITSPTLRSLAVVGHYPDCGGAGLVRAAPRLASLRLELSYGAIADVEAPSIAGKLPSLVDASVRIAVADQQRPGHKRRKLELFKSMAGLLPRLSNVTNLHLSGFTTTALLDEKSQEFPSFHNLKTLHLDKCDVGVNCHALTSILVKSS